MLRGLVLGICFLAYSFNVVPVYAQPAVVLMSLDKEVICGNDVSSYANLNIHFSGTPPFVFRLLGTDGTSQTFTCQSHTFTTPLSPRTKTVYSIGWLRDASDEALESTLTASVTLFVSRIQNVSTLVTVDVEQVQNQNPTARIYLEILEVKQLFAAITFLDIAYASYNTTASEIIFLPDYNSDYVEFDVPTTLGDYDMEMEIDGCSYPFTLRVIAPETVIETIQFPNFKTYPNPTTGQLRIENGELKIENVRIFDVLGQEIFNFQFSTFNSIDISHLANGMYFLKIDNKVVKIVKE